MNRVPSLSRVAKSARFVLAALATIASAAHAQTSMADGLQPGDYLRLSGGAMWPVNAQGSLREWDRGPSFGVAWENWGAGSNGVGISSYAITFDYSRLAFDPNAFATEFVNPSGGRVTASSAGAGAVYQLATMAKFRIPSPVAMPLLEIGFGILNFQPATISYQSTSGNGTASQRHRTGASISVGGGLDKSIYGRAAIFGDALYTYAFTSLAGQSIVTAGGVCSTCDPLRNTAVGVVRGGLRIRIGQ